MCPCQLMFCELISGITNVKARLITMIPTTQRTSMLSCLPTTNVAPNEPEHRARRARGRRVRGAKQVNQDRSAQCAEQVQRAEPSSAQRLLQRRTDDLERVHVEQDVGDAVVQERRRQQPIQLAVGDSGRPQHELALQVGDDVCRTNITTLIAISV